MYEGKKASKCSFMCFFCLEDEQYSNIMVKLISKYSPYLLKTATTLYRIVIVCTMCLQNISSPNPLKTLFHIKQQQKKYDVRKRFIFSRIYIYIPS